MKNILLILVTVSLNAGGQLLIRKGMLDVGEISFSIFVSAFPRMIANIFLWLAFICYGASVLLWIIVLSKVEVSYAYAFSSLGYILATIIGVLLPREQISAVRIFGIVVVCFGIILVAKS